MNIYEISCYSDCGSYFAPYLQSVSVAADSKEEAIQLVKDWLKKEGHSFIKTDEKKWSVALLQENIVKGVFDYNYDTDY